MKRSCATDGGNCMRTADVRGDLILKKFNVSAYAENESWSYGL